MGDEDLQQAKQSKVSKPEKKVKQEVAKAPVKTEKKEEKKGLMEKAKEKIQEAKKPEEKQAKVELEREYIVPLRQGWLKVPEYKRANKAVKTLKEFIAQHMKVYDRDLRKIKVDILLNNEIRFRGMKKPPARIKVKAIKYDTGIVEVKLVDLPKHIEFELARKARKQAEAATKQAAQPARAPIEAPKEEKSEAEIKEEKEKEKSSKEAMEQLEKAQAKQAQHTPSKKAPIIQRKALQK